jgi:hypothetical protein
MNKIILIILSVLVWLVYSLKQDIEYNKTHIERTRYQIKQFREMFLDSVDYAQGERVRNGILFFQGIGYFNILHEGFAASAKHLEYLIDHYDEHYVGVWDSEDNSDHPGEMRYSSEYLMLSLSLHHVFDIQDLMPGAEEKLDLHLPDIHTGEGSYLIDLVFLAEEIKKKYASWLTYRAEDIYWHVERDRKRDIDMEQKIMRDIERVLNKAKKLEEEHNKR